MTTNKPEVVAWRWRKPVVNDQGETVGATDWKLSETPEFLSWWTNEPLVRLSDYESLQADRDQQYGMKVMARKQRDDVITKLRALYDECEKLRKDAERYRWLRDGSNKENSEAMIIAVYFYGDKWDEMIDAAIAAHRKQEATK